MKNKFIINGDETTISLSSGEGYVNCLIDTKSLEILNDFDGTFRAVWSENTKSFYAMGYVRAYKSKVNVMMHRLIMSAPNGMVVDHVNHDTLDNRKKNLVVTTQSENMKNPDEGKIPIGKIKGISWYEDKQKWRARKGNKHIGYFENLDDAVLALEQA